MHQIEYLLDMALQEDKQGQRSQAQNLYQCAIQLALEAVSCQSCITVLKGVIRLETYLL